MQIASLDNEKDFNKDVQEQNKLVVSNKKPSILKKKKMPPTKIFSQVDLKFAININDFCFVNEESLRNPDTSQETLLKTLYHYKMISKVTLNDSIVNIQLKSNSDNVLPPEYFCQRLKSFGDKKMANIAFSLENIHKQFSKLKQACPVQEKVFDRDNQETMLKNFLQSMEGRKFLIYYTEITPQQTKMKNIIFSLPLLQALRCNIKNIAMDFLKYKHIFFEVFTAKNYLFFIETCLSNIEKIQTKLMQNPNMTQQQKRQLTQILYYDQAIRQKQGPEGLFQQIVRSKVLWFSPHPSICCFQILQMEEQQPLRLTKKRKINNFEQTKPEQELEELRKIGITYPLLQIQDNHRNTNAEKKTQSGQRQSQEVSKNIQIESPTTSIESVGKSSDPDI